MGDNLPEKRATASELVFYQTEDGQSHIQVRLDQETVWLTQRGLADLYQISVPTVNHHIAAIYEEGELSPEPTTRQYLIVQTEGRRRLAEEAAQADEFDRAAWQIEGMSKKRQREKD